MRSWIINLPRNVKCIFAGSADLVFVPLTLWLAYCLRLEQFYLPDARVSTAIGLTAAVTVFVFARLGLYRAVIRFAGNQVLITVAIGITISALFFTTIGFLLQAYVPRPVPVIYLTLAIFMIAGGRLLVRIYLNREIYQGHERVIIYGAGSAGRQLATTLSQGIEYQPVAFVDDDKVKEGTIVQGLRVHKPRHISRLMEYTKASKVLLAIASLTTSERARIVDYLNQFNVKVQTIPGIIDIMSGRARIGEIRDIKVEELLGRDSVKPDEKLLAQSVTHKNVMVVGAGGTIGGELCRQIMELDPQMLILVETSEFALYSIEQELKEILAARSEGSTTLSSRPESSTTMSSRPESSTTMSSRPEAEGRSGGISPEISPLASLGRDDNSTSLGRDDGSASLGRDDNSTSLGRDDESAPFGRDDGSASLGRDDESAPLGRDDQIRFKCILGDAQDKDYMQQVMKSFNIQTVYHAAAYKHVPVVEQNMVVGVRNNVFGTLHTAQAAMAVNVENFTLISTDKAVRPANIMGATKRLAELIIKRLSASPGCKTRFSIVRFGNVLDSSGSVVPLFKRQIRQGGPVTVTHPGVTRYFMTISEAVQLVIQASTLGKGGEVFVLNMGEPVCIQKLAQTMIRLLGHTERSSEDPNGEIEIKYIGLRPGEKLHEELLIADNFVGTEHAMIIQAVEDTVGQQSLDRHLEELEAACNQYDCQEIVDVLQKAVDNYDSGDVIFDEVHRQNASPNAKVTRLFPRS